MNKTFKTWAIALLLAALPSIAWAADSHPQLKATTGAGRTVTVTAVTDNIIKVTNKLSTETEHVSRAVVLNAPAPEVKTNEIGDMMTLLTKSGVLVALNRESGAVSINAGGDRAVSDNGLRQLRGGKRELKLSTMGKCSFYGAGERGYSFNLEGDTLVMYNKQNYGYTAGESRIKQMNITMPLFVSSAGYAVLFDDYAAAEMIMKNPVEYITESPDPVTYYFINGAGSLSQTLKEYTALTGRQDLPPFWSLGYITSKYGYHTEAETRGVIDTLKLNKYPVDGVVLDLYWYGKEQDMGRLAWDAEQWPTHKKMLKDLKDQGVNMVIISQPYVLRNGRGIDNYNFLAEKGMLVTDSTGKAPQEVTIWVGEGGMLDVSNPQTRQWLANRYKELTLEGVGGWWGDLGEPEVHPETGLHANGLTARQYHNQYGNDWSEIVYDLFKSEFPDTRLMTMMRGGTAGLQRYSVYPWSTDVSRSWGGLKPQITIMLNSGLSGLGYMSHDVGGFAIDPENPVDPELYVRWLQLGIFSPILRTHAQAVAEPYRYPEQQHIILPLIKERYRWLPYNYTTAFENALYGAPMVRPLDYNKMGDKPMNVEDQYLWGDQVMVAPVLEQGAVSRNVVFPAGEHNNKWVDYNNPTNVYSAGETTVYDAPLEVLPMFVAANAVIPTADYHMANTGDYDPSRLTLNCYPVEGENQGNWVMFEDDRTSTGSIRDNTFATINLSCVDKDGNITVKAEPSSSSKGYAGMPAVRRVTINLYNVAPPAAVNVNGKKLGKKAWKYDAKTRRLTVNCDWKTDADLTLTVSK